jgi:hypothetical protein
VAWKAIERLFSMPAHRSLMTKPIYDDTSHRIIDTSKHQVVKESQTLPKNSAKLTFRSHRISRQPAEEYSNGERNASRTIDSVTVRMQKASQLEIQESQFVRIT